MYTSIVEIDNDNYTEVISLNKMYLYLRPAVVTPAEMGELVGAVLIRFTVLAGQGSLEKFVTVSFDQLNL
jgi:hypothetical protein